MQFRPCDCTPMCVLRSENPLRIRRTRADDASYAEHSVYRPSGTGGGDLATRLTEYAVLAHDPSVRDVAADYWLHSRPYYHEVLARLDTLTRTERAAADAFDELVEQPDDVVAERRLRDRLAEVIDRRPDLAAPARESVRRADRHIYIGYLRGADYRGDPSAVTLDDLRTWSAGLTPRPEVHDPDVLVVIPLMDRGGTGRIRNLMACLLALHDQSLPAHRYQITVVEFDTEARWRHVVEPVVDHYRHIVGGGAFNKSWTLNVGVRHSPGKAPVVCLLDADILPDRRFLERNLARFDDPGHAVHVPHTDVLSLDLPASDAVIEARCREGRAEAPLERSRGLLLRDVPGACLWLRRETFDRVGGLDERYLGWGGEDEDMLVRCAEAAPAVQCDEVLLHLAHVRPPMRNDQGDPFNAHLLVGSWTGSSGYGELSGPVSAAAG
ncbi:galactosyltransferase-related protein [Micromonospora sp. NPDC000207]|uniref:glycosyltransferase n=1 Tax=Micromonospora sp. NPDC000207 TaxID=3154246 RepID=UPI00331D21E5